MDAVVERTGMYSQDESPSGERRSSGGEGPPGGEGALGYSVSRKLMSTNFCTRWYEPDCQGQAVRRRPGAGRMADC